MTDRTIDFYFDFSSPYAYLAAQRVEAVAEAAGAAVVWRPFLLGAVFKVTGNGPLTEQPLKGAYATRDLARRARRIGVPFRFPDPFPFTGVAASRAFYWLEGRSPAEAVGFARRAFAAIFGEGCDLSKPDAVVEVAAGVGDGAGDGTAPDAAAVRAGMADPAVKARLRAEVDAAMARGVCGSPFFLVQAETGNEPFWGDDRLDEVADWLSTGGW